MLCWKISYHNFLDSTDLPCLLLSVLSICSKMGVSPINWKSCIVFLSQGKKKAPIFDLNVFLFLLNIIYGIVDFSWRSWDFCFLTLLLWFLWLLSHSHFSLFPSLDLQTLLNLIFQCFLSYFSVTMLLYWIYVIQNSLNL